MEFFGKKQFLTLGIDISSYSIEVMAISSERDVIAYERAVLKEGIIQNGIIQQKEVLKMILDKALAKIHTRTGNLRGVNAVVNIPDQQTYAHYFDVPVNLSGTDLAAYLQKEAETVIPLETGDMTASYVVLGKPQQYQTTKRVLFVGARKDVTQAIQEILHAVDLRNVVLDMESTAFMRAFLPAGNTSDAVMILDGGSETSAMHIFEGRSLPMVSVAYPEGGVHATRRIAEKLNLSFEEAEKMKCAFGLLKAPRVASESDSTPSAQEETVNTGDRNIAENISIVLHDWYQLILSDIQKAITFYEATYKKRVSSIILAGGGALLPGITAYLTAWTGRPVRAGNPLIHIRNAEILGKEKPSIVYATVIGLALRGVDPGAPGVDFTHGTVTEMKKSFVKGRRFLFSLGFTVGAILLVLLLIYIAFVFFNADAVLRYEKQ